MSSIASPQSYPCKKLSLRISLSKGLLFTVVSNKSQNCCSLRRLPSNFINSNSGSLMVPLCVSRCPLSYWLLSLAFISVSVHLSSFSFQILSFSTCNFSISNFPLYSSPSFVFFNSNFHPCSRFNHSSISFVIISSN